MFFQVTGKGSNPRIDQIHGVAGPGKHRLEESGKECEENKIAPEPIVAVFYRA